MQHIRSKHSSPSHSNDEDEDRMMSGLSITINLFPQQQAQCPILAFFQKVKSDS